jgi:hypothetical protein
MPYTWSGSSAVWQVAHGEPGSDRTASAREWLEDHFRRGARGAFPVPGDLGMRLLTALEEVRQCPPELTAALAAGKEAASSYAESVADFAIGESREKRAEEAIDFAADSMAAAIAAIAAALPAGWQA